MKGFFNFLGFIAYSILGLATLVATAGLFLLHVSRYELNEFNAVQLTGSLVIDFLLVVMSAIFLSEAKRMYDERFN